jgi:hypothetical protein
MHVAMNSHESSQKLVKLTTLNMVHNSRKQLSKNFMFHIHIGIKQLHVFHAYVWIKQLHVSYRHLDKLTSRSSICLDQTATILIHTPLHKTSHVFPATLTEISCLFLVQSLEDAGSPRFHLHLTRTTQSESLARKIY